MLFPPNSQHGVRFQSKHTGCPLSTEQTTHPVSVMFPWEETDTCAGMRGPQRGQETSGGKKSRGCYQMEGMSRGEKKKKRDKVT